MDDKKQRENTSFMQQQKWGNQSIVTHSLKIVLFSLKMLYSLSVFTAQHKKRNFTTFVTYNSIQFNSIQYNTLQNYHWKCCLISTLTKNISMIVNANFLLFVGLTFSNCTKCSFEAYKTVWRRFDETTANRSIWEYGIRLFGLYLSDVLSHAFYLTHSLTHSIALTLCCSLS